MITGWKMLGSDEASMIVCTPVPGMLNATRFVVPIGGGFALDALMAWRSVQSAPHVVPSVSAVDVTVNVIDGVAVGVGVGVGVTSGESAKVSRAPGPFE